MTRQAKVAMVLFALSVCLTGALAAHWWREAATDLRPALLYAPVLRHIEMVCAGDLPGAYRRASSEARRAMDVEQFANAVAGGLPGGMRGVRVELGAVEVRDRRAWVRVVLVTGAGEIFPCTFGLVREGLEWRVNAARFGPPAGTGKRMAGQQA